MVKDKVIPKGYKQTDVGVIPEDWEVKKFGEIVRVIGGGAFKSKDSSKTGVKWLKIANVGVNKAKWDEISYLPHYFIKENESFLLKTGDCVIALTRPILGRQLKITRLNDQDTPALLNQRVGKIVSENNNNLNFVYYLFQKYETINELLQGMSGTDPPNLSNNNLYKIDCSVPKDKEEQFAIAQVLSDTDELITALEKLITKKQYIKQGAMQELLTGKRRLPGFQKSSGYKQTDVGVIPEDWEIKKIAEIAQVNMGQSPNSSNYNTSGIGLPLIQGKADIINRKSIQRFFTQQITKICNDGDVIMTVRAPVGYIAKATMKSCIGRGVCSFIMVNCFINFFKHSMIWREKYWQQIEQGSTFSSANSSQIFGFILYIPKDVKEQAAIAQVLSDMDAEIDALEQKKKKYIKIKQGMMSELLTGRIRIV